MGCICIPSQFTMLLAMLPLKTLFLLAQSERFSFLLTSSSPRPLPLSLRVSHRHRWRLCPRRAAAAAAAAVDPNGGAKATVESFFKGLRRNDRKRSVLVSIFSHILNRVCGSGSGQAVHFQGGDTNKRGCSRLKASLLFRSCSGLAWGGRAWQLFQDF